MLFTFIKVLCECMQISFVAFVELKNTGARPFKWLMFDFSVMIRLLCPCVFIDDVSLEALPFDFPK